VDFATSNNGNGVKIAKFFETIKDGHIPRSSYLEFKSDQNVQDYTTDDIKENVLLWFRSFVLQRTIGRIVAMTAFSSGRPDGTRQLFQKAVSDKSGLFDTSQFIDECRKSLMKLGDTNVVVNPDAVNKQLQRHSHGRTSEDLDAMWVRDTHTSGVVREVSNLDVPTWPHMLQQDNGLHINVVELTSFITQIHKCFLSYIDFKHSAVLNVNLHMSPYIVPLFRSNQGTELNEAFYAYAVRLLYTIPNNPTRHTAAARHVERRVLPESEEMIAGIMVERRVLPESEEMIAHIMHVSHDATQTLIDIMKHPFEEIRVAYVSYNRRFDDPSESQSHVDAVQTRLSDLVHQNLGIYLFHTDESIPSRPLRTDESIPFAVGKVLQNMDNSTLYSRALGSLVTLLCRDYSALVARRGFAAPEAGSGSREMPYWDSFQNKLYFFMYLLLVSLHSCTDEKDEEFSSKTRWLHQMHSVVDVTIPPGSEGAFTDSEHRQFRYPNACLALFQQLFPCDVSDTLQRTGRYTVAKLLECMNATIPGNLTTLPNSQYDTFFWKRRGYISIEDPKSVVEHMICVVLILTGVDKICTGVVYDGVTPPPPVPETEAETKRQAAAAAAAAAAVAEAAARWAETHVEWQCV
jgi:hypothetical protein